jgi:hypothetical protein
MLSSIQSLDGYNAIALVIANGVSIDASDMKRIDAAGAK